LNGIFLAIVLLSFLVAGYRQITWSGAGLAQDAPMQVLSLAMIDSAASAVTLAIGLVGVMKGANSSDSTRRLLALSKNTLIIWSNK